MPILGGSNGGKALPYSGATLPPNNSILNAMLKDMAQATVKGRAAGAGTGVPVDLTAAQLAALLSGEIPANGTITTVKLGGSRYETACRNGIAIALGYNVTAANTVYFPCLGGLGGNPTEANVTQRLRRNGTCRALWVYLSVNTATGGAIALRAAGADTAGILNPSGAGTGWVAIPLAVGVALTAGQALAIRVAPTGGGVTIDGVYLEVDDA